MRIRFFYLLFFSLIFGSAPYVASAQTASGTKIIPGRLVFKLKPQYKAFAAGNTIQLEKLTATLASIGATQIEQKFPRTIFPEGVAGAVDLTLVYQINLPKDQDLEKARRTLMQTGLLEYAETLRNYQPLYLPNDPQADSVAGGQYYLKNIKAYRAWDFTKGDTNIVIGILDQGVKFSHQDLKKNIKYNYADPIDGIDNDNDGYIDNFRGWDVAENDNDPSNFPFGDHGVLVAGVSSAVPDNGKGLTGVGFNCKFLPIKVYANTVNGHGAFYEGIVYAAEHGCHVINLSWGDTVPFSAFEQDVVNYAAINRNAVVIAAAGNTRAKLDFYPASYQNVLSVATLDAGNSIAYSTTYSYNVDISAPGIGILTTYINHDSSYVVVPGGSSFAAPMVSGAAGLVKQKFPQFNAQQIMEQLRVTADASIYNLPANSGFQGQLGTGLLNVAKAVSTTNAKSVRYTNISNTKGTYTSAGDTLNLLVTFKNFLQPVSNLNVVVTSASANATVLQGNFAAGAMVTLGSKTNTLPFKIKIANNTPVNHKVVLRFDYTDGTYSDYQYYELIVNPDYVTIDVNKVAVTVTSRGSIGYDGYNWDLGSGVRYKKLNLLAEGAFLAGTSAAAVSDNVFNSQGNPDADFYSQSRIQYITSQHLGDMEARGIMQDSFPAAGMTGVNVQHRAYAWQSSPNDHFVILEYVLKNITSATLTNLYAGIYADWDLIGASQNTANWDASNKLGYVKNVKFDSIYAGVKLLTNGLPSYYAFDNRNAPAGTIIIGDGFTDAEKYQALSGGVARTTAGSPLFGNDVSHIVATKVPDLAPNQSERIAFAILAADNLAGLQTAAQNAQIKFNDRITGRKPEISAGAIRIYPNPATDHIQVEIPQEMVGSVQIEVVNAIGKTVGIQTEKPGNTVQINTSGLVTGLYLVKVKTSSGTYIQKVQVLK